MCLLEFVLFYSRTMSCSDPATAATSLCRAVPWVIPGCQPRSREEREAVRHVSFASLSPGQPAGSTEGLLLCSGGGS